MTHFSLTREIKLHHEENLSSSWYRQIFLASEFPSHRWILNNPPVETYIICIPFAKPDKQRLSLSVIIFNTWWFYTNNKSYATFLFFMFHMYIVTIRPTGHWPGYEFCRITKSGLYQQRCFADSRKRTSQSQKHSSKSQLVVVSHHRSHR